MVVVAVAGVAAAVVNAHLPLLLRGPCNDGDSGDGASNGGVAA